MCWFMNPYGNVKRTTTAHSSQKQSDKVDEIFQAKTVLNEYLKKKCYSKQYQELSIKYFVKSSLIPEILPKYHRS